MLGIAAYALIAGGLLVSLWRYPAVALAGVLCMFGLEQWGQATSSFFAQHQTATNFFIGSLLLLALLLQGFKKGLSLFTGYPAVGWLTLALFLYAFFSTQWAPRPDLSIKLWIAQWPYMVTFLIFGPLVVTETKDVRAAFMALLLVGGALSLLLLFFVKWEARRIVLMDGTGDQGLGNPLAASAMASMVALIAMLADPWPRLKAWLPLKWFLITVCLILVVRSGSRGQLLGVMLVSVVCWPLGRGLANMKQFVLLSAMILFLGVAAGWTIQEFSSQQTSYGGRERWSEQAAAEDVSGRLTNAMKLVHRAYASPDTIVFGLGNSASYDPRLLGIYPHFVLLEVLAEEGLIGFGLYGLIIYSVVRSTVRSFRATAGDPIERILLGGLAGLCLFNFILSLKQGSLLLNVQPFMLAIIIGRYERLLLRNSTQEEWADPVQPVSFTRLPAHSP